MRIAILADIHANLLALEAVIADLEIAQLADDGRANNHAHEQRREAGECRPEGDVTENTERRKMRK